MPVLKKSVDFVAKLKYLKTEQGGRKTPAFSGYRPQVKFDFIEMQTSGQQVFMDQKIVYPGEEVTAEISLLSSAFLEKALFIGQSFEFREGSRVIGHGQIIEVINKILEKDIA